MKLRYFIPCLIALVAVFATSCSNDNDPTYYDNVRVSSSFVTIPIEGGAQKIILDAGEDWCLDFEVPVSTDSLSDEMGKVKYDEYKSQLETDENKWFTVSPASGRAGRTEITFSADAAECSHTSNIKIKVGDTYQNIVVAQISDEETPESSVVDVINGPDSKNYKVTGTCTKIDNTNYGNWYLQDAEGNEIYIYGTVDASGAYNWNSFDIAVGDVVTVEGPKKTYNGTVELVDVSVVKVVKALLSTKEGTKTIAMNADAFTIAVKQLGEGLTFSSKSEWIKMDSGYSVDDKGNFVFTLHADANNSGAVREGTIVFESTKGKNTTKLPVVITQLWQDTKNVTVAQIAADITAGAKTYDYTLTDAVVTYKNGSNFFVEDSTGGILIYDNSATLKVGDKINGRIWGKSSMYNNLPEITLFRGELAKIEEGKAPKPTVVKYSDLVSNYDRYMSCYVELNDVTIGSAVNVLYSKVVSAGSLTDGKNELAFNHQSTGKYDNKKIYYYIQAESGSKVNVICIPSVYKTNKQLNIWEQSWISK